MPPTLITSDRARSRAFRAEHQDIILKPLYRQRRRRRVPREGRRREPGCAAGDVHRTSIREPVIVQRYLPGGAQGRQAHHPGRRRVRGAINRVPAAGEARSNMHVGGRPEATTLTPRDKDICAAHRTGTETARPDLRRHRRDRRLISPKSTSPRRPASRKSNASAALDIAAHDLGSHRAALPGNAREDLMIRRAFLALRQAGGHQ